LVILRTGAPVSNATQASWPFAARFAEFAALIACLRERDHGFGGAIHHFVSAPCAHRKALLRAINSL
jgi:hypothetical protein